MNLKQQEVFNITSEGDLDYSGLVVQDVPNYMPFEFEKIDWPTWLSFLYRNQHFPIYTGLIYISVIFGIQTWMRNREAFNLKRELFLWNAALGLYSIVGFIRIIPDLYFTLVDSDSLFHFACTTASYRSPWFFWSMMFVVSKYVELGDTVFIVLRKKPLQFIQWYHHIITLSACWLTAPLMEPFVRIAGSMNLLVHSFMYPYFALKALDYKIPRQVATLITTLQMLQMLTGLFFNAYSGYFYATGAQCYRHPQSIRFFFVVYGSFVILFGRLFYQLVISKKSKRE